MKISFEVEQKSNTKKQSTLFQKIGGEYKVTDQVAIEADRELKQKESSGSVEGQGTPPDSRVFLKYKKSF